MRIIADLIAVAALVAAALCLLCAVGMFSMCRTAFDEIAAIGMFTTTAALLTSAAVWGIVAQNARAQGTLLKQQHQRDREQTKLLEDLLDRGYDIVDRLDRLDRLPRV